MYIVHRFSFNQKTGKRALDILHLEHVPYESNGSAILISHKFFAALKKEKIDGDLIYSDVVNTDAES